jgi:hypothetical protein
MTEEQKKRNRVTPGQARLLVMMPEALVERLDLYAEWMGSRQPGVDFTRSDSIRALLIGALDSAVEFNNWVPAAKPPVAKPPAAKPQTGKPS